MKTAFMRAFNGQSSEIPFAAQIFQILFTATFHFSDTQPRFSEKMRARFPQFSLIQFLKILTFNFLTGAQIRF